MLVIDVDLLMLVQCGVFCVVVILVLFLQVVLQQSWCVLEYVEEQVGVYVVDVYVVVLYIEV